MPLLALPPEVLDQIIDILSSHKSTLRVMAVSCRAFLPRARYHLLHTARVKRSAQAVKLITVLENSPCFHTFIRRLRVDYDSPLVPQLLARLPGLQGVILSHAPLASTLLWVIGRPEGLKEVESLVLRACTFRDASHVRSFVARFPALHYLRLRSVRVQRRSKVPGGFYDDIPHGLSEVSLGQADLGVFAGWQPNFPISLTIALHGNGSDTAYCRLIQQLGSHLRTLSLKMPSNYHADLADDELPLPDLSHSSSLTRLEITNVKPMQSFMLTRILCTCVSGVLKELTFELLDFDPEMPPSPPYSLHESAEARKLVDVLLPAPQASISPWSNLDALLASSRFTGLKRVVLGGDAPMFEGQVEALIHCTSLLNARKERIEQLLE